MVFIFRWRSMNLTFLIDCHNSIGSRIQSRPVSFTAGDRLTLKFVNKYDKIINSENKMLWPRDHIGQCSMKSARQEHSTIKGFSTFVSH